MPPKSADSKSSTSSKSKNNSANEKRDQAFHIMSERAAISSPSKTEAIAQLAVVSKPLYTAIKRLSPNDPLKKNLTRFKEQRAVPDEIEVAGYKKGEFRIKPVMSKKYNPSEMTVKEIREDLITWKSQTKKYDIIIRFIGKDIELSWFCERNGDGNYKYEVRYQNKHTVKFDFRGYVWYPSAPWNKDMLKIKHWIKSYCPDDYAKIAKVIHSSSNESYHNFVKMNNVHPELGLEFLKWQESWHEHLKHEFPLPK